MKFSFANKHPLRHNNNYVSPTEIEGILQKHPAVFECLVFGTYSASAQELVTAVVVKKDNYEVSPHTLIAALVAIVV